MPSASESQAPINSLSGGNEQVHLRKLHFRSYEGSYRGIIVVTEFMLMILCPRITWPTESSFKVWPMPAADPNSLYVKVSTEYLEQAWRGLRAPDGDSTCLSSSCQLPPETCRLQPQTLLAGMHGPFQQQTECMGCRG